MLRKRGVRGHQRVDSFRLAGQYQHPFVELGILKGIRKRPDNALFGIVVLYFRVVEFVSVLENHGSALCFLDGGNRVVIFSVDA